MTKLNSIFSQNATTSPRKPIRYFLSILLIGMLLAYFTAIVACNFWLSPFFIETDMYADMKYAEQVWVYKSIFPKGWLFGNQLYAVATPVLAAFFIGLTGNPSTAMGIASTLMSIFILLSMNWMLKPLIKDFLGRLFALVALLSITLAIADPIWIWHGWQLLFIDCSYYACYLITVFLAIGCYLRWDESWNIQSWAILLLTCLLSFGTGIQSLRQTAVMICPLFAVEFIRCLFLGIHKEKVFTKSTLITAVLSLSNLAGLLYARNLDVSQRRMFSSPEFLPFSEIPKNLLPSYENAMSLFSLFAPHSIVVSVLCVILTLAIWCFIRQNNQKAILCLLFFTISPTVILFLDTATDMPIRNLYYFILYPFTALLVSFLFTYFRKPGQCIATAFLIFLFIFNYHNRTRDIPKSPNTSEMYHDVVQVLEENQISTVYSVWNLGEKFALTSDFSLDAGFWPDPSSPFQPVLYLCHESVFQVDPSKCAYAFRPEELDTAQQCLQEQDLEWELLAYCPGSNIYLYTSDTPLMHIYQ